MSDDAMILALMAALVLAIVFRLWRRRRFRQNLVRDFLNDPERRRRQGLDHGE